MKDNEKTQKQLIKELTQLRRRIAEWEALGRKRNQFEETLRMARDKAQQYLDIAEVILVALNKKGEITLINRKGNQILGYKKGELLGKNWFTTCVPAYRQKKLKGRFLKLMSDKIKLTEFYEDPALTKSGTERIMAWHNTLLKDAQGNTIGTLSSGEDISERHRMQEALRESEEKYRLSFNNVTDVIYTLDSNLMVSNVSPSVERALGYKVEEVTNRPFPELNILASEYLEKAASDVMRVFSGEHIPASIYEFIAKDGTRKIGEVSGSPLYRNGKIIGLISVARDITERKKYEEELSKGAEQFHLITSTSMDGFVIVDVDGRILDVNEAYSRMIGYNRDELLKMSASDIEVKLTPKEIQKKHKKTMVSSQIFQSQHRRKDGVIIDVELSMTYMPQSGHIFVFLRDITERKRVEEELRHSEERYRTILENTEEGYYELDLAGNFVFFNDSMCRIYGYPREELMGLNYRQYMDQEAAKKVFEAYNRVYRTGEPGRVFDFPLIRKDKTAKYIEASILLQKDLSGKPIGFRGIVRDITERKRVEEALKERQETINAIIETSQDWIWAIDSQGVHTYSNPAIEKILGYPVEEIVGSQSLDFMHEDDKKMVESMLQECEEKRCGWNNLLLRWRHKNGAYRYLESSAVPILNTKGDLVGFRGVDRDITERNRAGRALEESEKKYRQVVENATDIIYTTDINGNFKYANSIGLKVTGYSLDELQQFNYLDLVLSEYRDQLQEIYGNQFRSRQATTYVEFPFSNKFGEVLWFGQNASLIIEGERIIGFQVIARDISERKRAEEALRESEEKYRDLVENINDIMYATDESGIVTYISPTIESISGYTVSEIIGRPFLEFVYQEDMSDVVQFFQQDISDQAAPREYRMMTKAGDVRWARTSSRPFFKGDRIVGLRGILTDITDRRKAEETVKRGYEQLQETLHSTVKALAATVEMKDQYTAGHQPRVTQLACAIAEEMSLAPEQIQGIRMAASIHDIGKIMVPAEILNKPGPLTEIQYEMIKMHPQAGYDILKGLKLPWPVAQIILQHHEMMDGSGYPQGLSGEKIMVEARILAVANVVEAMNAHRPYRPAHDIKVALEEISKNRGILYDPAVVDACLRLFAEKGFTLDPVPR